MTNVKKINFFFSFVSVRGKLRLNSVSALEDSEVMGSEVTGSEVTGSEAMGSEAMGSEAMGSEVMGLEDTGSVTDLESALPMLNLNSVTVSDTVDSDMVDSDTEVSEVTAEVSEDISENDRSSVLDPFALMFHPHQQSNFCENKNIKN
jgi:hypothetical protein